MHKTFVLLFELKQVSNITKRNWKLKYIIRSKEHKMIIRYGSFWDVSGLKFKILFKTTWTIFEL